MGAVRKIAIVTVAVGAVAAGGLAAGLPPDERTYADVAEPVQSLMSVSLPFTGVLLVHRRGPRAIATALAVAVAVGVFGAAASVAAIAVTDSRAPGGPWQHAGEIALGGVLVQCVAQLSGTGLGLLVRRPVVASLLTIVVPLGLYLLLAASDALRPVQAWLTPYASARHLLAGTMTPLHWAQWCVMAAIWGLGLNLPGYLTFTRAGGRGRTP